MPDALAPRRAPVSPPPGRGLRRSAALLSAFRYEQRDPERFYRLLAADSATQLARMVPLAGARLLDVGGGPGYYREAFTAQGASYLCVDPDMGELSARTEPGPGVVRGSGTQLPVRDGCVDVTYCSNVLEHVAEPELLAAELLRVTRPGGTVYLSYTNWLSPNGGHETGPWHLVLGGQRAADRWAARHGRRPKNDLGSTLFRVSVARMLRWADEQERRGEVVEVRRLPRYHPRWAQGIVAVPVLREVLTWNLVLVLRRRG